MLRSISRLSGAVGVLAALLASSSVTGCSAAATPDEGASAETVHLALGGGALPLRGTNLSGAEFGAGSLPGQYDKDFTYPTRSEVDYFLATGMTMFRIPFQWERLQPTANGNLDATELGRLDALVSYATGKGATVLLDPHNYARYYGQVVGAGVGDDVFANFWGEVGAHYKGNPLVAFGLMNEPHDLPTEQWAGAANAAIAAIRTAGATNLILVPGNAWTGAHSWTESSYGTPNAQALLAIRDPGNNYAFEVHQYLDGDFSGTNPGCNSRTAGADAMRAFTDWLRANGKRGFLGEFGGGANDTCYAAVDGLLQYLEANSDVYLGWAWWAAGPWWGNYFLSIEPNGGAASMLPVLERHLRFSAPTPPAPTPAPTPAPSPAPAPPPSTGGALTASLAIASEWETGYCADVHVRNGGGQTVSGWSATIDARSSTLTQAWNVQVDRQGSTYTMRPVGWNQEIAAGGEIDFGFCADKAGDGAKAVINDVR
jgi:endoglucanase